MTNFFNNEVKTMVNENTINNVSKITSDVGPISVAARLSFLDLPKTMGDDFLKLFNDGKVIDGVAEEFKELLVNSFKENNALNTLAEMYTLDENGRSKMSTLLQYQCTCEGFEISDNPFENETDETIEALLEKLSIKVEKLITKESLETDFNDDYIDMDSVVSYFAVVAINGSRSRHKKSLNKFKTSKIISRIYENDNGDLEVIANRLYSKPMRDLSYALPAVLLLAQKHKSVTGEETDFAFMDAILKNNIKNFKDFHEYFISITSQVREGTMKLVKADMFKIGDNNLEATLNNKVLKYIEDTFTERELDHIGSVLAGMYYTADPTFSTNEYRLSDDSVSLVEDNSEIPYIRRSFINTRLGLKNESIEKRDIGIEYYKLDDNGNPVLTYPDVMKDYFEVKNIITDEPEEVEEEE